MNKKVLMPLFTLLLLLMGSVSLNAQVTVKGQVIEKGTNEPLMGVTVRTGKIGTVTNLKGQFSLNVPNNTKLTFSYIGYLTKEISIPAGSNVNLGRIVLESSAVGLSEVSVMASIIPKDRVTPVPLSNVGIKQIQTAAPNIEFPELLKSTPSVYVTKGSGGYGDSRINMRGFDSNNIGVLINGVPINDMESGKVYWSNWAGLSDVTSFIQVQRGLGASKLGLSSVGGTINMVTKSTDAEQGGNIYSGIGNDGYSKYSFTVSTGLMKNGWAVTLAGARTAGDGYVNGTDFLGWSYFLNVSKVINEKHRLSFTAFGAPQWHNQRAHMLSVEDYKNSPDGAQTNYGYGYINGKVVGGAYGYNVYHKPQLSLNHFWDINSSTKLYTSIYASMARGGGRRLDGANKNSLSLGRNGMPVDSKAIRQTPDGLLDYDAVMRENKASLHGSQTIFAMSTNSHNWYGVLSSLSHQMDQIKLTGGIDVRYYAGIHNQVIENLLGGKYYIATKGKAMLNENPNKPLKVGDKINYSNIGEVLWDGVFGQAEYSGDQVTGFLSATLTHQGYRYVNLGGQNEPVAPTDGQEKYVSDWANYLPWSIKGGMSYKFNRQNNIFVNAGYFTRAPYFRSVFFKYNTTINEGAKYERVLTGEFGYGFRNEIAKLNANFYYTKWLDKGFSKSVGNNQIANILGLNARHMGVELEASYTPTKTFDVQAMLSWGDWIWTNNVKADIYDENQSKTGEVNAFVKDVHVGNSAQVTGALKVSWEALKNLRLRAATNYFGKNFADFDPTNRTKEADKVDAWRMPDYYTVDLGATYRFKIGTLKSTLYMNVNNLTNVSYIADARDGDKHDMESALVYMGFGRTWSTGLRVYF